MPTVRVTKPTTKFAMVRYGARDRDFRGKAHESEGYPAPAQRVLGTRSAKEEKLFL